jgi:hypothetical protein
MQEMSKLACAVALLIYIWEIPGPNYKGLTAGFHVFMSLQANSIIHLIRPHSPPTTLFPADY